MTDKKPLSPELKAARERMQAKAKELLSKMDPELRMEIVGSAMGAFEETPENYADPAVVEGVPLTEEGIGKLADRPSLITDGFLAAFGEPFDRGRARGRLSKWVFNSEYFQNLIKKKQDKDGG